MYLERPWACKHSPTMGKESTVKTMKAGKDDDADASTTGTMVVKKDGLVTMNKKLDRKLYDAVKAENVELVKKLLLEGANPNAPVGKKGMTAMERAVAHSNRDIEQLLLQSGGKLHSRSTLSE